MEKLVLENEIYEAILYGNALDEASKPSDLILYISGEHSGDSTKRIFDKISKRARDKHDAELNEKSQGKTSEKSNDKFNERSNHELNGKCAEMLLLEIKVFDWDTYLTPWVIEESLGDRNFLGKACELLDSIEGELLEKLKTEYSIKHVFIAGYSLAGLFSMWSAYESDSFDGVASMSGSLWYPGFSEYAEVHSIAKKSKIYLSLGKKESKSGSAFMRSVGEKTLSQFERLKLDKNVDNVVFIWHDGGHFHEVENRIYEGICWLLYYH